MPIRKAQTKKWEQPAPKYLENELLVPQDNLYMADSRDKANLTSMSLSKQRDHISLGESRSQEKLEPKKKPAVKKAELG